ncbi:hypothetical protein BMR06_05155 [Methylococcaceae bacterium HT5]|nr:hypothetical protein BMR06_05155 [Methylococcaceae bacterium HT5]
MLRTQHIVQCSPASINELNKHIAFHEAGHVTAIYIRNKQQLPPVFFQITINKSRQKDFPFFAWVEGGRLIENLPVAEIENKHFDTALEKQPLKHAYEADVINLLAGGLAEAKFVALRDDEIFNPYLVNINALKNYGGHSDLEQANRYLEYFISNIAERELKIQSLFEQTFQFIEEPKNWKCIEHFANYLLKNGQSTISCEEASTVLEQFLVT